MKKIKDIELTMAFKFTMFERLHILYNSLLFSRSNPSKVGTEIYITNLF
jgi:hypothetical protein